jgi:hypothetical protein
MAFGRAHLAFFPPDVRALLLPMRDAIAAVALAAAEQADARTSIACTEPHVSSNLIHVTSSAAAMRFAHHAVTSARAETAIVLAAVPFT